jgi:hypothetical protein
MSGGLNWTREAADAVKAGEGGEIEGVLGLLLASNRGELRGEGVRSLLLASERGELRGEGKNSGLLDRDAYAGGGGMRVTGNKCGMSEPRANEDGLRFRPGGLANSGLSLGIGLSWVENRSRE